MVSPKQGECMGSTQQHRCSQKQHVESTKEYWKVLEMGWSWWVNHCLEVEGESTNKALRLKGKQAITSSKCSY